MQELFLDEKTRSNRHTWVWSDRNEANVPRQGQKGFQPVVVEKIPQPQTSHQTKSSTIQAKAAVAEVMREKLHAEYAAEVRKIRDAAKERQNQGGGDKKSEEYKKSVKEKIPEPKPSHQKQSSTIQAKAAGQALTRNTSPRSPQIPYRLSPQIPGPSVLLNSMVLRPMNWMPFILNDYRCW